MLERAFSFLLSVASAFEFKSPRVRGIISRNKIRYSINCRAAIFADIYSKIGAEDRLPSN
jgi:hypothetical protein